jgi:hypothetical protein
MFMVVLGNHEKNSGVAELEYERDIDGVGRWKLDKFVCCTNRKPYLNSATPE